MRDPLGLSPGNMNKLNSYNSTKDSLLNIQACLRDPCIQASKGRQAGTGEGEGEDRGGLRLVMDTVLQPGAQGQAQPGEGRKPAVAGISFSWKEHRDSEGTLAGTV